MPERLFIYAKQKGQVIISLFTIGDLHLSFGTNKPMDIFGGIWERYEEKIKNNWLKSITGDDTVVIPGDISWSMSLESAVSDFDFINKLPGNKIILKGNHDYWWTTLKKMNGFLSVNSFDTISILSNNYYPYGEYGICGSRGWINEESVPADKKILLRERQRLIMSLESCINDKKIPIAFLHYPPVMGNCVSEPIFSALKEYGVTRCYYGHIHGAGARFAEPWEYEGVHLQLVSCDCIQFMPVKVL